MSIYYVDFTTGDDGDTGLSEALAWKTIAKVNASSFSGDDQVLFKRGETWRETLIPPTAGTSGHQITFGAYGTGDDPVISGADAGDPTTPVRDYCIYDTDARGYITIDGIEVAYAAVMGIANDQWTGGALEVATPSWIVQNCTCTKCGITLFGPDAIVQDNALVGPQPTDADMGAIIIRGAVAEDCQVLRNTVDGFYGRGIWFMTGVSNPTANDNVVDNIAFTYGGSGEGYGINFDGYGYIIVGTVTCTGNTVSNCASNGIELENCSDGSLVRGNLVHDCSIGIIYMNYAAFADHYVEQRGNEVSGVVAYNIIYNVNRGVALYWIKDVAIWNNVITGGTGTGPAAIGVPGTNYTYSGLFDVRNNIFGDDFSYVCTIPGAWESAFSAWDHNRCPTDPVMHERDTSTDLTLAQLQAASACLNCFTDDPLFVDAENHDYRLQAGSPCINAGVGVGLSEDFAGHPIT